MKKTISGALIFIFILSITMISNIMAYSKTSGDFAYKISGSSVQIKAFDELKENVKIPETIEGYPVTEIVSLAFYPSNLKSITMPKGIKKIDELAFYNNPHLEKIIVDKNNLYFCDIDGVLFNKTKTVLVKCPEGKAGFYNIPEGVIAISDLAFYECQLLKGVSFPKSVTKIGESSFYCCRSFTRLYLPNTITDIGYSAFDSCDQVSCVTIPNKIKKLNSSVFSNLIRLKSVTIPESVTDINSYAFSYCDTLSDVYFLGNAPRVVENSFKGCAKNLTLHYQFGKKGFTNPWYGYKTAGYSAFSLISILPLVALILVIILFIILFIKKRGIKMKKEEDAIFKSEYDMENLESKTAKDEKTKTSKRLMIGILIAVIGIVGLTAGVLVYMNTGSRLADKQVAEGLAFENNSQYDKAIEAYKKAISIDEKSEKAYVGLSNVYKVQGKGDKAIEILQTANAKLNSASISSLISQIQAENKAAKKAVCLANLRTVDGLIQQDFVDADKINSIQDLIPKYLTSMPICPEGGKYTIVAGKGSAKTHVVCSIPGHELP